MPYEVYKWIHLIGIIFLFLGLTSLIAVRMAGAPAEGRLKSAIPLFHGVGLLFILISGFGLLARLGIAKDIPGWAYTKIFIWLLFGGVLTLIKKNKLVGLYAYSSLVGLFAIAAYLAIFKPF